MSQQQTIGKQATSVFVDDEEYTCVMYHNTIVVAFNNKEIILNTGGWRTLTTKTRMNQTSNQFKLGFHVSQMDYDWFVTYKDKTYQFNDNKLIIKR